MLDLNRRYRDGLLLDVLGVLETDESETAPEASTAERWWKIVQLSAFISWKEICEAERPVLRRMNVAQFEQNQRRLATALEEKRVLEVAFIRELWHERQASRRKGDFNGILVTRGPNSKRLLLEASKPLLRQCLLNIHYRSEHPTLISFSNHAFYSGRLQMPPSVHRKALNAPLLLIEVNGVYDKKQNVAEAQQVVSLLRKIWLTGGQPPTVGVVTFNEVQRDLIEDMLVDEAAK